MSAPPLPAPNRAMACRRCGVPLNTHGFQGTVRYLHSGPTADGHEPDPVPVEAMLTLAGCCDFCSDRYPLFAFDCVPLGVVAVGSATEPLRTYDSAWAACAVCAGLVDGGDLDVLWRNAMERIGWSPGSAHALEVRELHAAFLANRLPGRNLVTTTRWPDRTLAPTALPRMRERLTSLLDADYRLLGALADMPRGEVAEGLAQASPYWVDETFTQLIAQATSDLPPIPAAGVVGPVPYGLIVWAEPLGVDGVSAAAWSRTDGGWRITLLRSFGAGLPERLLQPLREQLGWLLPICSVHVAESSTVVSTDPVAPVLVTWLLIKQQLAEVTVAPPARSARRRAARTGHSAAEVRLVRLRGQLARPVAARQAPSSSAEQLPVEQRKWVSGFWRQQPYGPGRSLRRSVYVNPYLRGPADAPIDPGTIVRVLGSASTRPRAPR